MKLKKIPLSEQLKSIPMEAQLQGLSQKYMGARPESHADAIFQDTSVHADGNHPVPITNFMNAQCTYSAIRLLITCDLLSVALLYAVSIDFANNSYAQTSPKSASVTHPRTLRSSSIPEAPTCGFPRANAGALPATSTPSTTHRLRRPTRRTAPSSRSAMDLVV